MLHNFVPIIQKLKRILYICIYNIFKMIYPLKKDKIILASNRGNELEGNLLWIYNGLQKEKYEIKVLITNKTNFKYNINLIANMANAKYTIIDDFFPIIYTLKIRKNAKLIQVWHALGNFKKVGFSRIGKVGGPDIKSITHKNYTDVIVSSENIVENYMEAFCQPRNNVHALGTPRTDFFFDEKKKKEAIEKIYATYPRLKNKRVILFAPTFRGNGKKTAYYPTKYFDINKIYENLQDNEILIIKNHPFVQQKIELTKQQSQKIIDLTTYRDINELLLITDLLITDYSSVIFEYALLNKPIIFYVPDLIQYQETRDFYYDFEEYVYGEVCKNIDELIYQIKNTTIDEQKIKSFQQKFLNMCDGKATKRFIDTIIKEQNSKNIRREKLSCR